MGRKKQSPYLRDSDVELKFQNITKQLGRTLLPLEEGQSRTGRVKFFNDEKGFGFISVFDAGVDLFVSRSEIQGPSPKVLTQDEPVEFVVKLSDRKSDDPAKKAFLASQVTKPGGKLIGLERAEKIFKEFKGTLLLGQIEEWVEDRAFGMVRPSEQKISNVFFHVRSVEKVRFEDTMHERAFRRGDKLQKEDWVEFHLDMDEQGRFRAENMVLLVEEQPENDESTSSGGSNGYGEYDFQQRNNNKDSNQQAFQCWYCKETGHIARDCPKKLEKDRNNTVRQQRRVYCNVCEMEGHIARDCYTCLYCYEEGHFARDCAKKARDEARAKEPREIICHNCGKPNHIARNCPEQKQMQKQKSDVNQPAMNGVKEIICHKCGQPNHIARDCPVQKQKQKPVPSQPANGSASSESNNGEKQNKKAEPDTILHCSLCFEPGHTAARCPHRSSGKIKMDVKIGDTELFEMVYKVRSQDFDDANGGSGNTKQNSR